MLEYINCILRFNGDKCVTLSNWLIPAEERLAEPSPSEHLYTVFNYLCLRILVKKYVFLNGEEKKKKEKEQENFYNAWMLVVPLPIPKHFFATLHSTFPSSHNLKAYFRIALHLKICVSPLEDKTWGFRYR